MNIEQIIAQAGNFIRMGRPQDAVSILEPCLKAFAPHPEVLVLLGSSHLVLADYPKAIQYFERAYRYRPKDAVLLHNYGIAYFHAGDHKRAVEWLRAAVAAEPRAAGTWELLGANLVQAGEPVEALEIAAMLEEDGFKLESVKVSIAAYESMDKQKMLETSRAITKEFPNEIALNSHYAMNLCYFNKISEEELREAHLGVVRALKKFEGHLYKPSAANPDAEVLRIGILSSDFRLCAANNFLLPFVRALDSAGFSVYLYATQHSSGPQTDAYKEFGQWVPRNSPISIKIAERIAIDGINILIDIQVLSAVSLPDISAARPAPVQLQAIGYPSRCFWPWIDGKLTDTTTELDLHPNGEGETLIALERCFLCYDTKREFPDVTNRKFDPKAIRFGSFNNPVKLEFSWLDKFAEILRSSPGSTLAFKHINLKTEEQRKRIRDYFKKEELESRIIFLDAGEQLDLDTHWQGFNEIDFALDAFPYNGTTTTCDALAMGVLTLSAAGTSHASRVTYSILKHTGFEEMCTDNPDNFVPHVLKHSKKCPTKAAVRKKFFESEMNDEENYSEELSKAFWGIWNSKIVGKP